VRMPWARSGCRGGRWCRKIVGHAQNRHIKRNRRRGSNVFDVQGAFMKGVGCPRNGSSPREKVQMPPINNALGGLQAVCRP